MGKVKSIIAKDAEIVQQFKPTPHMQIWLDTAIELQSDSPTEISAVAEQRRENWYDWLKVPGFEDWYYENYKKERRRWLPTLDRMGMEESGKGKYDFWKDMRKAAGETEERPDTNINIINAIQLQQKKYDI
jgi:hypothetical protein